jgi:hypothetical protein
LSQVEKEGRVCVLSFRLVAVRYWHDNYLSVLSNGSFPVLAEHCSVRPAISVIISGQRNVTRLSPFNPNLGAVRTAIRKLTFLT